MKLRQKQPNPKKYRQRGTNLSTLAASGRRHLVDRRGRHYVFLATGQMVRVDPPKVAS